jgi:hypothetical protein
MKLSIAILTICLLGLPGMALAGACGSTTPLSSLLSGNVTCTIDGGDLTFTFSSSYLGGLQGLAGATFIPINAPGGGFQLSESGGLLAGTLNFTLSVAGTLQGYSTLIPNAGPGPGSIISLSNVNQAESTLTINGVSASYDILNNLPLSPPYLIVNKTQGAEPTTGISSAATIVGNSSGTDTAFTKADFFFSTPEPSAWLSLIALGALMILPIRRLQRRQAE